MEKGMKPTAVFLLGKPQPEAPGGLQSTGQSRTGPGDRPTTRPGQGLQAFQP